MHLDHRLLWDTSHVKTMLRTCSLSEGGVFAYFLAIMTFDWLQFTVIRTSPSPGISNWALVDAWFTFLLTIAGLGYLFICNGGTSGRDFLYRYFPLSVVVGWKFVAAMFLALWLFDAVFPNASHAQAGWCSAAILAVINMLMLFRIGRHIKAVAHAGDISHSPLE